MSVAAAGGAVSAHQPTQEQIRLARLIEDKKHDQPEVQEILRMVLDVVADCTSEDALVALYDCDYDFEKTVAMLIERGCDMTSEWRTATNSKTAKKQQQQRSVSLTKNRQTTSAGDTDENVQYHQRRRDDSGSLKKPRGNRSKFSQQHQQQQDGADSQNTIQSQEHFNKQQKPRGGGSNYRGRQRGNRGGGHRNNDRNNQQDSQDLNFDNSSPSDTVPRSNTVSSQYRRGIDTTNAVSNNESRQISDHNFDVGNWNGETLIYSRTMKEEEQPVEIDLKSVSKSIQALSEPNGQSEPAEKTPANVDTGDSLAKPNSKPNFDQAEATLHLKNMIGIGQNSQQKQMGAPSNSFIDSKTNLNNQSGNASNKSSSSTAKSPGQTLNNNNKATPTPQPRIPQQPVVFSDRFDGGVSKIDVEFGNLGEGFDEKIPNSSMNVSQPLTFYSKNDAISSPSAVPVANVNTNASVVSHAQRSATLAQHASNDQSAFMPAAASTNANRGSEQVPMINQRIVVQQMQQQSMAMKPGLPQNTYIVHQDASQLNPQTLSYQSILLHHPQQRETVVMDNAYDPSSFQSTSEYNAAYYMQQALPTQQQGQGHFIIQQPMMHPQQVSNARPSPSNNAQNPVNTPSSISSTTVSSGSKKGPSYPPGFLPPGPTTAGFPAPFPSPYGVSLPISNQQQTPATSFTSLYDHEHSFNNNQFIHFNNQQSAQSPTGGYGSVTPPVQAPNQQQGLHSGTDGKTLNISGPINENLLLLQQYTTQHPSNQQPGQQAVNHTTGQMNYLLSHAVTQPTFPGGHAMIFSSAATSMNQQQTAKQQREHYNQRQNPSSNKDNSYHYGSNPGQGSQNTGQSVGQQQTQQSGSNKNHRGNNVYNNSQNQQRSYQ